MYLMLSGKEDWVLMSGQATLEFNCANAHADMINVMQMDI
jgi:hypothetical protein